MGWQSLKHAPKAKILLETNWRASILEGLLLTVITTPSGSLLTVVTHVDEVRADCSPKIATP